MNVISRIFFMALVLFGVHGCYFDNEETLYPSTGTGCDTSKTKFAADIYPIIDANCNSCHSNNSASSLGGNISLEGYDNVKIQASSGKLAGVISHDAGFSAMPKGASKLPDCKITQIKKWIAEGMLNN